MAKRMDAPQRWEIDVATELCLLGLIILPDRIVRRVNKGKSLSPEEFVTFRTHLEVAEALISHIPRMQNVGRILRYQYKNFDGSGIPEDNVKGGDIPLGSRILKVALHFDWRLDEAKGDVLAAIKAMHSLKGRYYDPEVLDTLGAVLSEKDIRGTMVVPLSALKNGMTLASDIYIDLGDRRIKALAEGYVLTRGVIDRLKSIRAKCAMSEIKVYTS